MSQMGSVRRRVGGYSWRDALEGMEGTLDEMVALLEQMRRRAASQEAVDVVAQLMALTYEVRISAGSLSRYQERTDKGAPECGQALRRGH